MNTRQIFTSVLGGAFVLTLSACGEGKSTETGATNPTTTPSGTGSTGSTGSTDPTDPSGTDPSGTTGTETDPSGTTTTTGGTDSDTDCNFIDCDSSGGGEPQCDVWAQDCPEGEKCAGYSSNGNNSWDANKCVAVDPAPDSPGAECTVELSGVSGIDSCGPSSMCWDVDFETNEGVCVEYCEGSKESPTCAAGKSCAILNDGVLILCLDQCDPLLQDCPGDDACLPNGESFICVLDASGPDLGAYADPCEYANSCDPGLVCMNPEYVEDCPAAGCCSPWCDIDVPNECPGDTQDCIPWYEEGMAPPGYESVGVCGIPQ